MTPSGRPTRVAASMALLVALGGVLVGLRAPPLLMGLNMLGFMTFAGGLIVGSREWVAAGTVVLGIGMVLVSLTSFSRPIVLLGTIAIFVSWDLAEHAISLGTHVGHTAGTRRNEIAHASLSAIVGVLAISVAITVSKLSLDLTLPAFLVFILGAIVLISVLRA